MKPLQRTIAYSGTLAFGSLLYGLCDTTDDEFWKSSWAIKLYVWLFEHSVGVIMQAFMLPLDYLLGLAIDRHTQSGADTIALVVIPLKLALLFAFIYSVARWGGRGANFLAAAICVTLPVVGVTLLAIDTAIPRTEWTFEVVHADQLGWESRWPNRTECERQLRAWRAKLPAMPDWQRSSPGDVARCIPPGE